MLAALKYKDAINEWFYLGDDDITIYRKKDDDLKGKFKKNDIVKPYKLKGGNTEGYNYGGIWIPRVGKTISFPWVLIVLRNIEFEDNMVIDHIDGNTLNNSRDNMRIVSQRINTKNKKLRYDNKTGYIGLTRRNDKYGYYIVRRTINDKRICRSAKVFEDAVKIWHELNELCLKDGYSERHGK